MIQYCNFEVEQEYNRVELCADYFYVPSFDENCSFTIGTPQCWDDTFFERFSMDSHESLHIFTHLVERKNVNRITDYKGVWGLKKYLKVSTVIVMTFQGEDYTLAWIKASEKSIFDLKAPRQRSLFPQTIILSVMLFFLVSVARIPTL